MSKMSKFESYSRGLAWPMALLLSAFAAGCGGGGGGQDPILGTGPGAVITPDKTKPRVFSTVPVTTVPDPTLAQPTNTLITVTFTEEMAQASIQAVGTVTVACGPGPIPGACANGAALAGVATYAVGSKKAVFTPTPAGTLLEAGKTYIVTIKGTGASPATDVAGNPLAGISAFPNVANDYAWSFETKVPIPAGNIAVTSNFPAAGALTVCPSSSVTATFAVVPVNPIPIINILTLNAATFTVTGPGPTTPLAVVGGSYALDITGLIATFTPGAPLAPGSYIVTIKSGAAGVKDTAIPGDPLLADVTWTFTVIPPAGVCLAPIPLGATVSTFGALSCQAITGSAAGTGTTVNGNIGTELALASVTGWVNGGPPAGPGIVNGTIYANNSPAGFFGTSATAVGEATTAFNAGQIVGAAATNVLPTTDLGAVVGFGPAGVPGTFFAGAYRSGSSMEIDTPITLDPQGDANAVWVFYMLNSTLTTTAPGNIILVPPAQAKNVFWVVGSSATLGAPLFSGNVLAAVSISVTAISGVFNARLLTGTATCGAVDFSGATAGTVNIP